MPSKSNILVMCDSGGTYRPVGSMLEVRVLLRCCANWRWLLVLQLCACRVLRAPVLAGVLAALAYPSLAIALADTSTSITSGAPLAQPGGHL